MDDQSQNGEYLCTQILSGMVMRLSDIIKYCLY